MVVGGTTVWSVDITAPGDYPPVYFGRGCPIPAGVVAAVVLSSGGTASVGTVNATTE